VLCFTRSDVEVIVDILVPNVNASNGVFVAARVDQGGCTTFLANGVYFFLLFGQGHVVIATDLGKCSVWYLCEDQGLKRDGMHRYGIQALL